MKKQVLIDARMITLQGHGIARYVQDILRGLAEIKPSLSYDVQVLIDKKYSDDLESDRLPGAQWIKAHQVVPCPAGFLSLSELEVIPKLIAQREIRLYHSPSFSGLFHCPCPWLLTVHDLNHLRYGSLAQRFYYQTILRPFIRRAQRLVTVSEFSRAELSDWTGIETDLISVVPNQIDLSSWLEASQDQQILKRFRLRPGRYFFTLATNKEHKNLELLIRAYERFKLEHLGSEIELVLPLATFSQAGIRGLGGETPLTDQEVGCLVRNANSIWSPSLYEGFGRPPLEAFLMGKPVVLSDILPHREIFGHQPTPGLTWAHPRQLQPWIEAMGIAAQGHLTAPSAPAIQALKGRYCTDKIGKSMDRLYRDVLDEEHV